MLLRTLVATSRSPHEPIVSALEGVDALVRAAGSIDEVHRQLAAEPFDLVILEHELAPDATSKLIRSLRELPERPEIIVLIDEEDAVLRAEFTRAGACAVLVADLPANLFGESLTAVAERRLSETRSGLRAVPDEDYRLSDYVTRSELMQRVLASAQRVAAVDATVLLLGETGVGKGLLARSIHNEGPRVQGPFVAVNCGALTESLLEAELFGHERGAFTGADRARRGYFELAHKGTLFLDEIGEMPLHLQVKLLQVLEDRKVRPVGSEKRIPVDVRLIAATNKNLLEEVKEKRFREDLFYRLNVVSITLPPLRERTEDLAEIAQSYVEHYRVAIGGRAERISGTALDAIRQYPWPGNVRELANAIERAVIMGSSAEIQVEDLAVDIQMMGPATRSLDTARTTGPIEPDASWTERPWADVRRSVLEEVEIRYLRGLLEATRGRIGETATRAGMDPRSLHQKMKKYGLRKEDFRA